MLVIGKKNKQVLLKDEITINQRNDNQYRENIIKLGNFIKKGEQNGFDDVFLDKSFITNKKHVDSHEMCGMNSEKDSSKLTEKRICRCMYYFNSNKRNDIQCNSCRLKKKYKNISNEYIITNAEVPTKRVINSCGGIDLIINDEYAVEVKPKNSTETLVRMITEIYTYTIDSEKNYKRAIAFFKGSKQETDYYKYKEELNEILNNVSVFMFDEKEEVNGVVNFDIVKLK